MAREAKLLIFDILRLANTLTFIVCQDLTYPYCIDIVLFHIRTLMFNFQASVLAME